MQVVEAVLVVLVLQRIGEGYASGAQKAIYDPILNELHPVRYNPSVGTSRVSSSVISQGINSIGVPPSIDLPREAVVEAT